MYCLRIIYFSSVFEYPPVSWACIKESIKLYVFYSSLTLRICLQETRHKIFPVVVLVHHSFQNSAAYYDVRFHQ